MTSWVQLCQQVFVLCRCASLVFLRSFGRAGRVERPFVPTLVPLEVDCVGVLLLCSCDRSVELDVSSDLLYKRWFPLEVGFAYVSAK